MVSPSGMSLQLFLLYINHSITLKPQWLLHIGKGSSQIMNSAVSPESI